jgi:putative membrane protein
MSNGDQNGTTQSSGGLKRTLTWMASAVALVSYVSVMLTLLTPIELPGKGGWLMATLVMAMVLATLVAMLRQLPAQNVLLVTVIVAVIGGATHALCATTAIPFGPMVFTDGVGPQWFHKLAWPMPFIWIVAVLNSRGVARLILRPWRKLRTRYGFWVIGLSAVLTVVFCAMLEPFASRVKHYWLWEETKLPFTWYGTPVTNFLGWVVVSLLILAFITPVLIKKRIKSRDKSVLDYHPLISWVLLDALFAAGAATQQLWWAVILCAVVGVAVTIAAISGSRW